MKMAKKASQTESFQIKKTHRHQSPVIGCDHVTFDEIQTDGF